MLELADVERFEIAGPSLWDCIKNTMDTNMRARVYSPRALPESAFQRPIRGGEPIVRWIFMQVRAGVPNITMTTQPRSSHSALSCRVITSALPSALCFTARAEAQTSTYLGNG